MTTLEIHLYSLKSCKGVIYCDGPILSGMQGGDIRMQGSTFNSSLQAGQSFAGVDPSDPQYRIYLIKKDWKNLQDDIKFYSGPNYTKADYSRDYNEWPIDMGAPYELDAEGNRVAKFIGDEQAWYVMNDLNPGNFYGTVFPCGTEWQALVWAYMSNSLANVIFKKYTIYKQRY